MTIINMAAQPYTSEYFQASTGSIYALTTGNYFPQTGVGKGLCASRAFISAESANIRYRFAASAPATNCGHLLVGGAYLALDDVSQMQGLKFMNEAGTATAYVYVTYSVD